MAADGNVRAEYTIQSLKLDTPQLNAARMEAMWESGAMEDITEENAGSYWNGFAKKIKMAGTPGFVTRLFVI